MKCPLPLTLEAREKMRGHGKGRGRKGGEMGDRYKKKEKDFIDLALGVFLHVFLDPLSIWALLLSLTPRPSPLLTHSFLLLPVMIWGLKRVPA
jgi:hypothetical protein